MEVTKPEENNYDYVIVGSLRNFFKNILAVSYSTVIEVGDKNRSKTANGTNFWIILILLFICACVEQQSQT
jgi:hypothetical protein